MRRGSSRPAEGLRHLELATHVASGALLLSIGTRPDVHGTAWAAHACWLLGHDTDALSRCNDAIKLARTIDHPYSLAVALAYGAITHQVRRDISELTDTVGELRDLCERYGFAYYRDWALVLDGWSRMDEPGIDLARRGISSLRPAGSFARMPYWLSLLADMLARNNQPGAARAALDAAVATGHARDDLWWMPEVMRMRAAHDDAEAASSRLRSAARLFWALRGGGGNFGVVTSFTFRFAYRDGGWAGVIVGVDPDPAQAGLISQWARDYWQELHPTSAGGAYVNFLMDEGQDRVKSSYRINQNIQPATGRKP